VQHFPFLDFLPAPVDGWCDLTELFVRRYGVPALGRAIFIRTRQHINGWNDLPKEVSARITGSIDGFLSPPGDQGAQANQTWGCPPEQ
jgi:hypothetical protein